MKDKLLEGIKRYIEKFYGNDPSESQDFGRIVNEYHTERLGNLIDASKVIIGGTVDVRNKYISPTLVKCDWNDQVMEDEIFGPLLPVIKFDDLDGVITEIKKKPKPLALYTFSKKKRSIQALLRDLPFGGGCINDVMTHAGNPNLPFGGVGASGIGSYHGKHSYETFSHIKSILDRKVNIESNIIYPLYNDKKLSMIKKVLK